MNKLFRLSLVALFGVLVLSLAACGSKSAGDVADEVADAANTVLEMHTVDAKHYTIAIPNTWKHNGDASHANILDENDQPRVSVNRGVLGKKQTGLSVAAAEAKKMGGTAPTRASAGIYTYTVENRAGEQVPAILKVRGKSYAVIHQARANDDMAAKVADSLYLK